MPSAASLSNSKTPAWITWALGSGAFAATNGVFAKLTTASHTHDLALWVSNRIGLADGSVFIEVGVRAAFFGLNLLSNAIMWILFTRALTAGSSTTRVSILNTSANFMVTALLGMLVFSETLPALWWVGAALLVAGSVIIGAREGGEAQDQSEGAIALDTDTDQTTAGDAIAVGLGAGGVVEEAAAHERFRDEDVDDVIDGPGVATGLDESKQPQHS